MKALQKHFAQDGFRRRRTSVLPRVTTSICGLIDPIDGTRVFSTACTLVVLRLALMVNDKIACGLIFDPNSNELFSSIAGKGCFVNDKKVGKPS